MKPSTRDRLVLPILLPLGALVFIALLVLGFSRVLLSLSPSAATVTASVVAFGILLIAVRVATLARIRASSLASMLGAVAGVAMLAGGIALAAIGQPEKEVRTVKAFAASVTAGPKASVEGYEQTKLSLPSGKPIDLTFDNQETGVLHNVVITVAQDTTSDQLFRGEVITGLAKAAYHVKALQAGTYYFHCEIHPTTMTGSITVSAGGGGGSATLTVSAQNIQFDTEEIDLQPNTDTKLAFDNKDGGIPHNIDILTADPAQDPSAKSLFSFPTFPGPASKTFTIPGLAPGTYFFRCDVHPTTMTGTVTVSAGGGGGGGGGGGSPVPTPTGPASPTATPTGGGGGGTAGSTRISAQGIQFDTDRLSLPANAPATITFDNMDAGIPHNVAIYTDDSLSKNLFRGEIVTGPTTVTYQVPALPAGTYFFHCDVHATMRGTVTVG